MKPKRASDLVVLLVIALVVSLPFYSANALAVSVSITKNTGEAGIENFIDAQGDVWTVEATIAGALEETIDPEKVKIKIGEREASFGSCSDGTTGIVCQYLSPLTDGIPENEYQFNVLYDYLNENGMPEQASRGDVIKADGSAPEIKDLTAAQNSEGEVVLDFTVTEEASSGAPAVGLQSIEIIDADSGQVLQTIADFEPGEESYRYGEGGGILPTSLEGEGLKRIKVRVADLLGHERTSSVATFRGDFIPPEIKSKSLEFVQFGRFIGESRASSDLTVDVVETKEPTVVGFSEQTDLGGREALCTEDEEELGLWHCIWEDVEVQPEGTISVKVIATDEKGNQDEKTVGKSFTVDSSPPEIEFFGSMRTFEGASYVKSGENRILLSVKEEGAGMNKTGIKANLRALGGSIDDAPDECELVGDLFTCYWDVNEQFASEGMERISLYKFEDNVGNEGSKLEIGLHVDTSGPKITKIEIYGVSEVGEKDYFQSNDRIKIKFTAFEKSGLMVLVDLDDLVMDAETNYPENYFTPDDSWQIFTEESCERGEEEYEWVCEIETEAIKSGPDTSANLDFKIQDTAGNDATDWEEPKNKMSGSKGNYQINLLGLTTEANPDYWESRRGYPLALLKFVDLDAAAVAYTRIPLEVRLKSDNPQAKLLKMELMECIAGEGGAAPEISRSLLYGGNYPEGKTDPSATLILEFSPFDGRQLFDVASTTKFTGVEVEYDCLMKVYSKVGKDALEAAELQEVTVKVPFAFSTLGAIDESLAQRVTDLKESDLMKFYDVVDVLSTVFQWIDYVLRIARTLVTVIELVDLFSDVEKEVANDVKGIPGYGQALYAALTGTCFQQQVIQKESWEWLEWIQIPTSILSCNPGVSEIDKKTGKFGPGKIDLGWYGWWQDIILETYNVVSARDLLGVPATSLYDNMYVSAIGLCLPGIVYNVNKAREIHCRKIVCYGREVPAGFATIDACDKLYDLQMCEWVLGPLIDFTPVLSGITHIGKLLKSAFSSPLGIYKWVEIAVCAPLCFGVQGDLITACKFFTGVDKVATVINNIVSAIDNRPDLQGSPYCDMAENIKVEDLAGGTTTSPEPEVEDVEEEV